MFIAVPHGGSVSVAAVRVYCLVHVYSSAVRVSVLLVDACTHRTVLCTCRYRDREDS